jgi:CubicO group peptidase (beta-lactamase class C family)
MKTLAHAIQPFVEEGLISGAVLLAATADRTLSVDAVGESDLENHRPMNTDALFWIASMTKPMTCTALMMLVDEGLVNVDDPVEKYLPEFKGQMVVAEKDDDHLLLRKPSHPILVREILSHTAGLTFSSPIEVPTLDQLTLRHAVRSYAMTALQFEPGTRYQYSNAGTNIAGRIIEVVTGTAYEEFMAERLFAPLGMTDTTFWPDESQLQRFAKIYRTNPDATGLEEAPLSQLALPFNNRARKPMPAGGLFSTAADAARFCQMILNDGEWNGRRYLSPEAVRQMTRKQTADSVDAGYGFGWEVQGEVFGHGGAYKTRMQIDRASGLVTVFLIHLASDWRTERGREIMPAFNAAAEKLSRAAEILACG